MLRLIKFFIVALIALPLSSYAQNDQDRSPELDAQSLASAEAELAAAEQALLAELKQGHAKPEVKPEPEPEPEHTTQPTQNTNVVVTQKAEPNMVEKTVTSNVEATKPKKVTKVAKKAPPKKDQRASTQIQKEVLALEQKLDAKAKALNKLQKQLRRTRDQLMVAETEIERLSVIIDKNNQTQIQKIAPVKASLKHDSTAPKFPAPTKPTEPAPVQPKSDQRIIPAQKVTSDMPIVTVVVDKANLRTGPGTNNSPLMQVAKGTRLAVETRVNDWFRIITPTGSRAWVSADVIRFGKDLRSSPTRTIKIRGYSPQEEDEAFEFIKNSS